jgi:hypothetical protein
VFNCGGDNRFTEDDEIYKQRSLQLSITAAKVAVQKGVKCWVELSSGSVYKADREPRKETDKLKPWLRVAKYKLEAEEELKKIEGCVQKSLSLHAGYPQCRIDAGYRKTSTLYFQDPYVSNG